MSYTTSYSLMELHGKWVIVKSTPDSVRKAYIWYIRNNAVVWHYSMAFAMRYSKRTAERHLRELRASDPYCDEDY